MYQSSNERGIDLVKPIIETAGIDGIFTMSHNDKWKFHRRLISPIFQASNLQKTDWIMIEKVEKLINRWKSLAKANGGQVELPSLVEFQNLTVDAIGHAAFGYDFNSINGNTSELVNAFDLILYNAGERIKYGLVPYWRWLPFLPVNAKLKKARELVQTTITEMIDTKFETYKKQKAAGTLSDERLDLMDLLLRASQENDSGKFSTDDLYAECFTFAVAGNETSAISLTFLFNLLGNNHVEQQKLRDEINRAVGNRTPTIQELNEISYLDMCIKEGLRIYPVAYMNRREVQEDMKIGGYVVPKGTSLLYSAAYTHNDERYWTEPKKFNPERFTKEEEEKRPMHAFTPFGGGLRICVGKTFALTEMKFATAMLLRDFQIDSTKYGLTGTSEQFVLRPATVCPFIVKPLSN
jgi:cytochrome P450